LNLMLMNARRLRGMPEFSNAFAWLGSLIANQTDRALLPLFAGEVIDIVGSGGSHRLKSMRQHFAIGDERHNQSRHATYPRLATALAGQLTVA
jgi:hypothetical protein